MDRERFQQIGEIYHAALEMAPEERPTFLDIECRGDLELRHQVESLLTAHDSVGEYFQTPAIEVAAGLLASQTPRLETGRTLNQYRVLSLLGTGGMGDVYLAEDTRLGRKVALKLLPAEFTQDHDRVRRFELEARTASSLNHPNILTIHDICQVDGTHFIVTEFVEGVTERQQMNAGKSEIGEALEVAIQVAEALSAAHSAGIVHRDIKPENLMIRPDGLVKVLDFGIAKLTIPRQSDPSKRMTDPGQVVGTPHYMSPEQARGVAIDGRSDIFSLGVLLYEMIAGRPPFEGATPTDVIVAILEREPTPLAVHAPEVSNDVEQIVFKALRSSADERYQTAREMVTDLYESKQRLQKTSQRDDKRTEADHAVGEHMNDKRAAAAGALKSRIQTLPRWLPLTAVGILLLVVLGIWLTKRETNVGSGPEAYRIAVLPFKNLGVEPDSEYFVDGLTDEVIRHLSLIEGLDVRSQTSSFAFKGKPRNLREVGQLLNVQYVVEGSVLRSGKVLRVTFGLVPVDQDTAVWSGALERELKDVFKIQDEISLGIVNQLRLKLGRGRRRYETSFEAYETYLRALAESGAGMKLWETALFEKAVSQDPGFAPAYAGLALAYATRSNNFAEGGAPGEDLERMRTAVKKALELDPLLPESHHASGLAYSREGNWEESEKSFRRAIELDPNRAATYHGYAIWLLRVLGRNDEALAQLRIAERLDPLSPIIFGATAEVLLSLERYDEAAAYCERLPADFAFRSQWLARARLGQGRNEEATRLLESIENPSPQARGFLGYAYARSGRREQAERMAAASTFANEQALIYAGLGDKERTFEALDRMADRSAQRMGVYLNRPELASLRSDPRLAPFRKKHGLP